MDVVELHGHGGGCEHRADNMVFKFGKNMPEAGCRLELHVCLFAVLFEISNDVLLFVEFARFNLNISRRPILWRCDDEKKIVVPL